MDQATRDRLQGMSEGATDFTPGWAVTAAPDQRRFRFDKLAMEHQHGVPRASADEKWTTNSYVAKIKIAVTAASDGTPTLDASPENVIVLLDGEATITTTDKRLLGMLSAGGVCTGPLSPSRRILFAVRYADVTQVEQVSSTGILGGRKVTGAVLACSGASLGVVTVVPVRGLNNPWTPEKRSVWGRGVGDALWSDLDAGAPHAQRKLESPYREMCAVQLTPVR